MHSQEDRTSARIDYDARSLCDIRKRNREAKSLRSRLIHNPQDIYNLHIDIAFFAEANFVEKKVVADEYSFRTFTHPTMANPTNLKIEPELLTARAIAGGLFAVLTDLMIAHAKVIGACPTTESCSPER